MRTRVYGPNGMVGEIVKVRKDGKVNVAWCAGNLSWYTVMDNPFQKTQTLFGNTVDTQTVS